MSETIEMFGQRIGQETGLGKPPLFIDGQTRLALMNLSHEAFCFMNAGYGNEQWFVWKNPKHVIAVKLADECIARLPIPESFLEKKPGPVEAYFKETSPVPEKVKSMFDGLWWSREKDKFFEVIGDRAWSIDEEGFHDVGRYRIDPTCGFMEDISCYVDERHCSTRTHPQGSIHPWPELKGRFRGVDPGNGPMGKLPVGK